MKKNLLFITVTLLFSILLLSACSSTDETGQQDNQQVKDELILAIGGEPEDGFDPTTGWGRYGSPLFQSTLLKYDKDFNIKNDLATDYNVSEDGKTWTVEIREDVKFSDGEALTADDVVFTFETAKTSGSVIDLSNLEKVESSDDHTVQFTLIEPASTFIYLLVSTGIVPEHAYDDAYNENPIGSGPFTLVQWDKGQQIIVEENPYYYGEKPSFTKLTFLFLAEDAAFAAAKAGEVDVVSVPPTFAKEEVSGMELIKLDTVDNRGVMFPYVPAGEVTDNGAPIGNDVTADIAIRKAINVGVDRQAFVDGVVEGFGTPAYSVADNMPWWNADTVIEDNDVEKAKQILDEAGWKENEDGIREKDGLTAEFTLLYPAGDQIRQSLSILFADMMKPLGIDVSTEGKSWNELETLMFSNPVMMGWGSHDPIEMYNLYSSETRVIGYYNANYYANDVVDEYMNQALHATTEEEANSYWQKAQWDGETGFSAQGDAPWAWLVNIQHLYFVNEDLEIGKQKLQPHGHGWPVTDFIEQWHWKE
ncbi:ABC transporter substrate-binding protein [Oceanobacillus chungangensis]|uniref:Nickel ABC transporter substrate-binding protein n=1 Tax=Oceanobacillus chungangensis TaxID=1229152 RepID=A0A3D8PIL7_9BACI|nr:ABC transporter substrate-binding protein [Oceanobacillus chungangensis]RDW15025.1 nickel ABC transporter substrate-binding protein [Oceanobacillus chungangensis]